MSSLSQANRYHLICLNLHTWIHIRIYIKDIRWGCRRCPERTRFKSKSPSSSALHLSKNIIFLDISFIPIKDDRRLAEHRPTCRRRRREHHSRLPHRMLAALSHQVSTLSNPRNRQLPRQSQALERTLRAKRKSPRLSKRVKSQRWRHKAHRLHQPANTIYPIWGQVAIHSSPILRILCTETCWCLQHPTIHLIIFKWRDFRHPKIFHEIQTPKR